MQFIYCLTSLIAAASALPDFLGQPPAFKPFAPSKYLGRWYEIGRSLPIYATFERNNKCVQARYSLISSDPLKINVQNLAIDTKTDKLDAINGTALSFATSDRPSDFGVSFTGKDATSVNYVVVNVWGDYEQALVGAGPFNIFMWILSRTPEISQERYDEIIAFAKSAGFNPDLILFRKTDQQSCAKADELYPPFKA